MLPSGRRRIPRYCSLRALTASAFAVAWGIAAPARADFVDVTGAAGVFGSQPTWGAQFVDMDLDGDIDLFNAHHFYSGFLFTNSGDGHFSVWGLPQVVVFLGDRHGWLWCDLDNDGTVVFDQDNAWNVGGGVFGSNGDYLGGISTIADLTGDGYPEIISGRAAWTVEGLVGLARAITPIVEARPPAHAPDRAGRS